jgi:MRG-binding protein
MPPPRKKAKASTQNVAPATDEDTPMLDTPPTKEDEAPAYSLLTDPWTDDQEISLLKGVMQWKPCG